MPVDWSGNLSYYDALVNRPTPVTERKGVLFIARDTGQIFRTDGSTWTDVTPSIIQAVNVKTFGAKGDGVTDDTAAIQAAINSATALGSAAVFFPAGTYIYVPTLTAIVTGTNSLTMQGVGDASILKVKNASIPTTGNIVTFNVTGGSATFNIDKLVFDGNSQNQSFATANSSCFYTGIGAGGNSAGGDSCTLRMTDCTIKNYAMGAVNQGIGLNTFGFGTQIITNLRTNNADISIWITQPFGGGVGSPSSINRGFISNLVAIEPNNSVITFEATTGVMITNVMGIAAVQKPACAGLYFITAGFGGNELLSGVVVNGGRFENLGNPVHIGTSGTDVLKDSILANIEGKNCHGTFLFGSVDSSCRFSGIVADNMHQTGDTSYTAAITLGGGLAGTDFVNLDDFSVVNNTQQAGVSVNSPARISNGLLRGTFSVPIYFPVPAYQQASSVTKVEGYNPVGGIAPPAIPASTVALTNPFGVDCMVTVFGGTVSAITISGTVTGLTSGAFRVPAGQTITLTYTVTPSWSWFGD